MNNKLGKKCKFLLLTTVFIVCILNNCKALENTMDNKEIIGSWVSEIQETEWGRMVIEFIFSKNNSVQFILYEGSLFGDKDVNDGKYTLKGNILVTTFENEATFYFKVKNKNLLFLGETETVSEKLIILKKRM